MNETRLGRVRAVWTDRHEGTFAAPTSGHPLDPRQNLQRVADALDLPDPHGWWWLHQVHGTAVVVAEGPPRPEPPRADALVTNEPGLALVVLTADCAPICLASDDAVGVVHAGWRGLLGGVVGAAVDVLRSIGHGDVRAGLGPCIHPGRYEFGRAELDRAVEHFGATVEGLTEDGRPALDLPAAVRAALARAGVGEMGDVDVCTAASPDHFSFRRDGGPGRQALVAVLER